MLLFDVLEIYLQLHTPNWSNILQLISQVKSFLTPPLVPSQGFLLWFCLFSSYLKLSEMGWVGYLSFLYSTFPFPVGMIALIISCLQLNVLHYFTIKMHTILPILDQFICITKCAWRMFALNWTLI